LTIVVDSISFQLPITQLPISDVLLLLLAVGGRVPAEVEGGVLARELDRGAGRGRTGGGRFVGRVERGGVVVGRERERVG